MITLNLKEITHSFKMITDNLKSNLTPLVLNSTLKYASKIFTLPHYKIKFDKGSCSELNISKLP